MDLEAPTSWAQVDESFAARAEEERIAQGRPKVVAPAFKQVLETFSGKSALNGEVYAFMSDSTRQAPVLIRGNLYRAILAIPIDDFIRDVYEGLLEDAEEDPEKYIKHLDVSDVSDEDANDSADRKDGDKPYETPDNSGLVVTLPYDVIEKQIIARSIGRHWGVNLVLCGTML